MYMCLCVFEGEKQHTERELRSGLRFVGSLGAGLCLFGLGSAQGAASLGPQTTAGSSLPTFCHRAQVTC